MVWILSAIGLQGPDQILHASDPMPDHVIFNAVDDFHRGGRMDEVGRADLDGRCPRDQEFERVGGRRDSADSDHRDLYGTDHLPDHPEGNRFYGGAGEAAGDVHQMGAPAFDIHRHPR